MAFLFTKERMFFIRTFLKNKIDNAFSTRNCNIWHWNELQRNLDGMHSDQILYLIPNRLPMSTFMKI